MIGSNLLVSRPESRRNRNCRQSHRALSKLPDYPTIPLGMGSLIQLKEMFSKVGPLLS